MGSKSESSVVNLGPAELRVLPGQVARYAGGARYRMNPSQHKLVAAVLEEAVGLIDPSFVYRVHEISGILESGYVELKDRFPFPLPAGEGGDSCIKYLALCVCTIGSRLEKRVKSLFAQGNVLEGFFMDAAGLAFLEALSARAYGILDELAKESRLRAGRRFGPGYEGMDLCFQKQLFELVEASAIGVGLNEACVMSPAKSLSFATKWTSSRGTRAFRHKCASCTLGQCLYRL